MICIKCKIDKENTEFRFRKDRQKYYTICKSCVNRKSRVEYVKKQPIVNLSNKLKSYSIKMYRIKKCAYPLCECVIEPHQVKYKYNRNNAQEAVYCSEWCKEVDTVDKKLARLKEKKDGTSL